MIIDGKKIAAEILAQTKARAAALPRPPRVVAIVGSDTPATRSYLKIKERRAADAGCIFETADIRLAVTPEEIQKMANMSDALIVQLPLPQHVNTKEILDAIPLTKDADVLSTAAREKGSLLPPVVAAIAEIFDRTKVEPLGKTAVVIGEGWLVGEPASKWLAEQGAKVSVANSKTQNLAELISSADIIVSGAGAPHLIKPEMLKQGVVLIDAATSESNGLIAGDADPACAQMCSVFTPVPGGVGPIAVACLFQNAVTLAERES